MPKKQRTARTYDNEKPIFKVLVAGEKGVGKTTLIKRYVDGSFLDNTKATIGIDFSLKNLKSSKLHYVLQIWDMAGEEKFRSILPNYMTGTHAVILAFETSNPDFDKIEDWLNIFSKGLANCIYLLISTKNDLGKFNKKEKIDEIKSKYHIANYYETSSKSNLNVDKVFNDAGNLILKKFNLI